MKRVLCPQLPPLNKEVEIELAEAKHLTTVLRVRDGESILLLDGNGNYTVANIVLQGKRVFAKATQAIQKNPKLNALPITLKMAILKGEAMEWVIEKSVELGVQTLVPIHTDYTVVQIQKKGADVFMERWQKIADQSLKQCGRLERLKIEAPMTLEEAFLVRHGTTFWLDEDSATSGKPEHYLSSALSQLQLNSSLLPLSLLVGPEGGFSPAERERLQQLQLTQTRDSEIKSALVRVHLGGLILRAETAALTGIAQMAGRLHQQ